MVFLGSEFKPACNGVNTSWFPGSIKINIRRNGIFCIFFDILSIV